LHSKFEFEGRRLRYLPSFHFGMPVAWLSTEQTRRAMRKWAFLFVALLTLTGNAAAQSPVAIKYCRDLSATYRKATTPQRPADPDVTRASINCSTNPGDAIPMIEAALKEWKVDLPPK
jgi:hypothetical protein